MAGRVPGPGRSSVSRHSHSNHGNGPSHRLTGTVPAVAGPSLPVALRPSHVDRPLCAVGAAGAGPGAGSLSLSRGGAAAVPAGGPAASIIRAGSR